MTTFSTTNARQSKEGGGHDGGAGQQCGPSEGAVASYGSWLVRGGGL